MKHAFVGPWELLDKHCNTEQRRLYCGEDFSAELRGPFQFRTARDIQTTQCSVFVVPEERGMWEKPCARKKYRTKD